MIFLLTSIVVIKINIIKKCQKKDVIEFENSTENSDPVVSVCVQTYQHVNYIKKCLEGILMQKTKFKFEIILGEDDSKDGTRDICIDYAKKYPDKIRLFLHIIFLKLGVNTSLHVKVMITGQILISYKNK